MNFSLLTSESCLVWEEAHPNLPIEDVQCSICRKGDISMIMCTLKRFPVPLKTLSKGEAPSSPEGSFHTRDLQDDVNH